MCRSIDFLVALVLLYTCNISGSQLAPEGPYEYVPRSISQLCGVYFNFSLKPYNSLPISKIIAMLYHSLIHNFMLGSH